MEGSFRWNQGEAITQYVPIWLNSGDKATTWGGEGNSLAEVSREEGTSWNRLLRSPLSNGSKVYTSDMALVIWVYCKAMTNLSKYKNISIILYLMIWRWLWASLMYMCHISKLKTIAVCGESIVNLFNPSNGDTDDYVRFNRGINTAPKTAW